MKDITNCKDPCACEENIQGENVCKGLGCRVGKACEGCHFYKPVWGKDMVRIEEDDKVYLFTRAEREALV